MRLGREEWICGILLSKQKINPFCDDERYMRDTTYQTSYVGMTDLQRFSWCKQGPARRAGNGPSVVRPYYPGVAVEEPNHELGGVLLSSSPRGRPCFRPALHISQPQEVLPFRSLPGVLSQYAAPLLQCFTILFLRAITVWALNRRSLLDLGFIS